jgi:hypothetical protein
MEREQVICNCSKAIVAIRVTIDGDIGVLSYLPRGSILSVCGHGMNAETVRVQWQGCFYYIFRRDLVVCRQQDGLNPLDNTHGHQSSSNGT